MSGPEKKRENLSPVAVLGWGGNVHEPPPCEHMWVLENRARSGMMMYQAIVCTKCGAMK